MTLTPKHHRPHHYFHTRWCNSTIVNRTPPPSKISIDPVAILPVLDSLAALNLPIWVTEFDWSSVGNRSEDHYPASDVRNAVFHKCVKVTEATIYIIEIVVIVVNGVTAVTIFTVVLELVLVETVVTVVRVLTAVKKDSSDSGDSIEHSDSSDSSDSNLVAIQTSLPSRPTMSMPQQWRTSSA